MPQRTRLHTAAAVATPGPRRVPEGECAAAVAVLGTSTLSLSPAPSLPPTLSPPSLPLNCLDSRNCPAAVAILGTSLFSDVAVDDFGRFNRSFVTVLLSLY